MIVDMQFDGQVVNWKGFGQFKASSGLPGLQFPNYQCYMEGGPIPEGLYKVFAVYRGVAKDDGTGRCNLEPGWGIQRIPRGKDAGSCEEYWVQWGYHRARLEPADASTRHACYPARGGFYLHDSTKGFSHGCIEVERHFFDVMRGQPKTHLLLRVRYVPGRTTYGGTRE